MSKFTTKSGSLRLNRFFNKLIFLPKFEKNEKLGAIQ